LTEPVYKIETWNGSLNHTIEKEAIRVYSKEIITDGIGHFSFTVPTKKNGGYFYDDIALNDKVKIWFGYDSVSGNPDFVGKVGRINGPLSTSQGYVRTISGLSQGEILSRRLKRWRTYDSIEVDDIVDEIADDLSLGKDFSVDTTSVTLHVESESYFDLLQRISDYWYSAGSQVKKDFYVDVSNNLVWKSRPIRTAGVESFTVGKDILAYLVTRDLPQVTNKFYVFGVGQKKQPEWRDNWTETLTNWTAYPGASVSLETTDKQLGAASIEFADSEGIGVLVEAGADRAIETVNWSEDNGVSRTLNFKYKFMASVVPTGAYLYSTYLFAPDSGNTAWAAEASPTEDTWHTVAYSKSDFVTGVGSPDYENIMTIRFLATGSNVANPLTITCRVDDVYFSEGRTNATIEDAASQASYGLSEKEHTDPQLVTTTECTSRGQTLLYQKKDPPVQIQITVAGNTNVLVGDRLSMTIPAENISAANYDVATVEHAISELGFLTTATMMNSVNIRRVLPTDQWGVYLDMQRRIRDLSKQKLDV